MTGATLDRPALSDKSTLSSETIPSKAPSLSLPNQVIIDELLSSIFGIAPEPSTVELLADLCSHSDTIQATASVQLARWLKSMITVLDPWVISYASSPLEIHPPMTREAVWRLFCEFYGSLSDSASPAAGTPMLGRLIAPWAAEWAIGHGDVHLILPNLSARTAKLVEALQSLISSLAQSSTDQLITLGILSTPALPVILKLPEEHSELHQEIMTLFKHFSVDSETGALAGCSGPSDHRFRKSDFRVFLIDTLSAVLVLVTQLAELKEASFTVPVAMAIDCEGVKLSRFGELALVQLSLSIDPSIVYVLDISTLGASAFDLADHTGCSLRRVIEDPEIRKVFYDPRHDCDAMFHQFGVAPVNVFDLQIAEVAARRARGLVVRYVQGLFRCLMTQPLLNEPQKALAERINETGKSLFEPEHGGSYDRFLKRPLHPGLLVYSSHDVRYQLPLLACLEAQLDDDWLNRVADASSIRAQWYLHEDYLAPTSEAPNF